MKIRLPLLLLMSVTTFLSCAQSTGSELKILYWNIQNGMWDGQGDNYERFVDWVSKRNPDICIWCEAQSIFETGTSRKLSKKDRYLVDNWAELALRYGHEYIYIGGHRDNYPQVITSRYPIANVRRLTDQSRDTTVSHGAGWARIEVGDIPLNIVTVHTWPQRFSFEYNRSSQEERDADAARCGGDFYRLKEMKYICGQTIGTDPSPESSYWLMAGDFNSVSPVDNDSYGFPPDSTCFLTHNYIRENTNYVDAVRKHSSVELPWTTFHHMRYDYVYVSSALDELIRKADVIYDDYTIPVRDVAEPSFFHPSDHLPIEVIIDLGKPKTNR